MTYSDKSSIRFQPSDSYLEENKRLQLQINKCKEDALELQSKLNTVMQHLSSLNSKMREASDDIENIMGDLFGDNWSDLSAQIKFDDLPCRAANALRSHNVKTYSDLLAMTEAELLRKGNFGRTSLKSIKQHLRRSLSLPVLKEKGWA